MRSTDLTWQPRLTWEWLDRIRDRAGLPLIVKGIQTAEDAELALEHGVEVIYVSNHGGRELDQAEAAIETLREVVDVVGDRAEIVVDGGFMRGTDVLKAIALGARAVGLGRLQALALAAGGAAALVRALELLEDEIRTSMGLLGVRAGRRARRELRAALAGAAGGERAGGGLPARAPRLAGLRLSRAAHERERSASTSTTSSRSAARTRSPSEATSSSGSTGTSTARTIGPAS